MASHKRKQHADGSPEQNTANCDEHHPAAATRQKTEQAAAPVADAADAAGQAAIIEHVTLTFVIRSISLYHALQFFFARPVNTPFGTVLEQLAESLENHAETCPHCTTQVKMPNGTIIKSSLFHYCGWLGTPFVEVYTQRPSVPDATAAAAVPRLLAPAVSAEQVRQYAGLDVPLDTPICQLPSREWTGMVHSMLTNANRFMLRGRLDVMLDLWRQAHELHTLVETRCQLTFCEPSEAAPRRKSGLIERTVEEKQTQMEGDGVWTKLVLLGTPVGSAANGTSSVGWRLVNAVALFKALRANDYRCVVTNQRITNECREDLLQAVVSRVKCNDGDPRPISIPKVLCYYV